MDPKEVGKDVLLGDWFQSKMWFVDWGEHVKMVGITIKLDPGGCLGVIRGITAEGPVIAFQGASTVDALYRKLKDGGVRAALKWRPDQFRLDRN